MYGSANRAAFVLMLVGIGIGACADGEAPRGCTLVGCDSGVELDLDTIAEADAARLAGARISVCLNGTCRDRMIDAIPPPNDVSELPLEAATEPRIAVSMWRTDPDAAIQIRVVVRSHEWEVFQDGDVYRAAVVGADGGLLFDRSWSVSYRTTQPNGPQCEPTCRSATTKTAL